MFRAPLLLAVVVLPLCSAATAQPRAAQGNPDGPSVTGEMPPKTWVDKDTGHRVWRVSDEPNSGGFYFNVNAFTPDGRQMVYNSPSGIMALDLASMKSTLLVPNPPRPQTAEGRARGGFGMGPRTIVVGHKTNSVFFTQMDPATRINAVYKADTHTKAVTKLIDLPPHVSIGSVNADETLGVGTYNEADCPGGDPNAPNAFGAPPAQGETTRDRGMPAPPRPDANLQNPVLGSQNVQAEDKGTMMERRLAARIPVVLFTIRLAPGPNGEQAGTIRQLLHSTDWIGHLLFSPTDPQLILYCHEGMWQKVDRIWLIHTDGTQNTLIHKRTMVMEIAGHEFWGLDGKSIWYDWQYPKGEDFFVAGYDLTTKKRTAYHLQRDEWSIHFNLTQDLDLFCGDGGDSGQVARAHDGEWIELFRPQMIGGTEGALNEPAFFQPGVFRSEHLVNMKHHNYRAEPNPRFSPDKKYVFFTSNMFGRGYVFAAEVAKAPATATDIQSTPELATKYNPLMPTPTTAAK
ncbi:MAG: oligogalacturonate lyase family protein [Acidobacteriota bacterium]|nr:oligogalacturonate lyase family protein [Acidobacteriota bacterium]